MSSVDIFEQPDIWDPEDSMIFQIVSPCFGQLEPKPFLHKHMPMKWVNILQNLPNILLPSFRGLLIHCLPVTGIGVDRYVVTNAIDSSGKRIINYSRLRNRLDEIHDEKNKIRCTGG